jgi:uncharacterized oligopeptide transporter (OPT) family protein
VAIGVGIALVAELFRIPSLPFAVGVYLPVSTMVPLFFGGMLRLLGRRLAGSAEQADDRRERGILLGSGLVGGEGLMGVLIAIFAGWSVSRGADAPWSLGTAWAGAAAPWLAAAVFAGLVLFFWRTVTAGGRRA